MKSKTKKSKIKKIEVILSEDELSNLLGDDNAMPVEWREGNVHIFIRKEQQSDFHPDNCVCMDCSSIS